MKRKVFYISGTRADFGLMRLTLEKAHRDVAIELAIVVTGMHLSNMYGMTVREIEAANLPIAARIPVDLEPATGATMARNIGKMLMGFVEAFTAGKPDMVLLLGDRGEMLAAALAAIHLNIPVAHIHGGERTGTIDEPVRHAISKLAHFHFVATEQARERLIRMGEMVDHVWLTGGPGLDGLESLAAKGRDELMASLGLSEKGLVALMVYHPVLQDLEYGAMGASYILDALVAKGIQVVIVAPNSDAGSDEIRRILDRQTHLPGLRMVNHFPREIFVSWMANVDLMIGNSSAGIIEAATFGTPVINIGARQNLRERNHNVCDVPVQATAIERAIDLALAGGRQQQRNLYGDGQASDRIVSLLRSVRLERSVLNKINAY